MREKNIHSEILCLDNPDVKHDKIPEDQGIVKQKLKMLGVVRR